MHRHSAWLRYGFGAEPDGTLVYAAAGILFDGGAYASSTGAIVGNGARRDWARTGSRTPAASTRTPRRSRHARCDRGSWAIGTGAR
ncbi:hypothetical protein [Pseudonocardia sp. MH-G8]|uniref:hypothetical protein n=1 Tax=Pseudonocardia sp. MH-G8 TaxID=1854588 RepID=UPI0018E985EA|nr:hypothetical protein [Pseudonocardia sp. MH-G8]